MISALSWLSSTTRIGGKPVSGIIIGSVLVRAGAGAEALQWAAREQDTSHMAANGRRRRPKLNAAAGWIDRFAVPFSAGANSVGTALPHRRRYPIPSPAVTASR